MNERLSTSRLDLDPSQDVVMRNQALEHLLNPKNYLPDADVYPILGSTFLTEDLAAKMPESTLLPAEEAATTGENVSLILGAEEKIAAGMILTPNNGLNNT